MGRLLAAVLVLGLLPASPAAVRTQDTPPPPQTATCVFTNSTYAGKCVETTDVPSGGSAQSACESILRCLNDPGCVRSYCRATEIRSGWRLESATAK